MFGFNKDGNGNISFNIDNGESGANIVIDADVNVNRIWGVIYVGQDGGGYYLQYEASLVNATRTQGNLVWYNSDGDVVGKYPAVSGSGNPKYYTIPVGKWEAGYLNTEYNAKFSRYDISFRITLGPDRYDPLRGWETSSLRIHPIRVGSLGTEGCIGLIGDKANIQDFYNRYTDYYNTYRGMPVYVIYQ